jgi:hypothetical protein
MSHQVLFPPTGTIREHNSRLATMPRLIRRLRPKRDPLGKELACTWRTLLSKVAAEVVVSTWRIVVCLLSNWPRLDQYRRVCERLRDPLPTPVASISGSLFGQPLAVIPDVGIRDGISMGQSRRRLPWQTSCMLSSGRLAARASAKISQGTHSPASPVTVPSSCRSKWTASSSHRLGLGVAVRLSLPTRDGYLFAGMQSAPEYGRSG